ncbi:sensor histidine kinase [Angustibacter sp. McL0619]|uniref:sensor histidine kinase n=1 Tax=Angustibacter sp. McL0619 TaxID=3415676 RepID=UPI003CEC406A
MRNSWGSKTWLALAYVTLGLPVGIITFTVVLVGLSLGIGLLPLFGTGVVILVATVYTAHGLASFERGRANLFLGVDLPKRPRLTPQDTNAARRAWALISSRGAWKEIAYCLLMLPVGTVFYSLAVAVWAIGLAGVLLPAYGFALYGGQVVTWLHWTPWLEVLAGFGIGLLALQLAPVLTKALADAELALVRTLLAPSGAELLKAEVSSLTESRARVVDAADAERRRIERDLHDGAQQHLVSLAMNLGMAKEKLDSDPEAAKELVIRAHQEAKDSITELRNVIRGVYPAVLTDRGLDAALSALAARSPVPVRLDVRLERRPGPTAEAIAYFVVSESLTNVARHSGAKQASVHIELRHDAAGRDRLQVAVVDDGDGGATEGAGSGLVGLRDRVRAVDGTFQLISPVGVGTTIAVEVPCES